MVSTAAAQNEDMRRRSSCRLHHCLAFARRQPRARELSGSALREYEHEQTGSLRDVMRRNMILKVILHAQKALSWPIQCVLCADALVKSSEGRRSFTPCVCAAWFSSCAPSLSVARSLLAHSSPPLPPPVPLAVCATPLEKIATAPQPNPLLIHTQARHHRRSTS